MAAEIRLFRGETPPVPAATGMLWREVQPGSGRWVELPEEFLGVSVPSAPPEPAVAPAPTTVEQFTEVMKQVQAEKKKLPWWIWPGIPITLGALRLWTLIRSRPRREKR